MVSSSAQRNRVMICLFALSVLQMGALAVASSIADIAEAFPDVSTTLVQMLITLPILVQTPVALLSGWFCRRFSAKSLLLTAASMFLIGGLCPFFCHIFPVIMLSRCVYGFAIGLQIPMVSTLTIEFFDGDLRAKMMGYCSAIGMLGGMFYTYAGGVLAAKGWQFSFLAYLVGIPVLLCVLFLFPGGIKTGTGKVEQTVSRTKERLPVELFWVAGISMVYLILYFAYTNNISLFVSGSGLGTAAQSGLSYSIVNGSGFLGGLLFGSLSKKTKEHMFWISAAVTALGFGIIGVAGQLSVLYVGSVFLGVGLSWFLPQCNLRISSIVPQGLLSFAYGLNSAISNLGQFLSVLVLGALCGVLGITTERGIFLLAFWGNLAVAGALLIYVALYVAKTRRQPQVQ